MQRWLIGWVALFFAIPNAQALDCENAYTTRDMVVCADQDLKSADKLLNAAYKKRRNDLDAEGQKLLKTAQRAWIEFRDAECLAARDEGRGGTIAPLLEISCLESMTLARTAALQNQENAMIQSDDDVIWLDAQNVNAPFDCTTSKKARVGLVPVYLYDTGKAAINARVQIDIYSLDFAIGGNRQNALCGPNVTLNIVDNKDSCPSLRLDDGLCDAFFISWDKNKKMYIWDRN